MKATTNKTREDYYTVFNSNLGKMPKEFKKLLKVLEAIGIPAGTWALGGSWSMLCHGVPLTRALHDIDIMVTPDMAKRILSVCTEENPFMVAIPRPYYGAGKLRNRPCIEAKLAGMMPIDFIVVPEEELKKEVHWRYSSILDDGCLMVTMESLVEVKASWKRPKDIEDLKLICPLYFPEVTNIDCIINMANDK